MKNRSLLLTLALLSSCSYKVEKEKEPSVALDRASLGFSEIRSLAFGPKCSRCHGNDDWMNSYPAAQRLAQEISERVQGIGSRPAMPPPNSPQLTNREKQAIVAWVAAGAPEVPGEPSPPAPTEPPVEPPAEPEPPKPDPTEPPAPPRLNFARIRAQVFESKCIRCHQSELDTYEQTAPLLSDIEYRVQDIGGMFQMPPANRAQLTEEEKNLLLEWIRSGAPKD